MNKRPIGRAFYSERELSLRLKCAWDQLADLAEHAGRHYSPFDIEQGSKLRHIDSPLEPLKSVQANIARLVKSMVELPPTMLGGIKEGSPKRNAQAHTEQPLVLKVDIRDCFPCITNKHVFRVFRNELGFSDKLARVLTKLTTFQRRLPQGSPASSILANIALRPLHDDIQAACAPLRLSCTFFVDDITISGARAREVVGTVTKLLQKHGFAMRARKVKLLARHRAGQEVTGVIVNGQRLSVGRERKNKVRARIHQYSLSPWISKSNLRSILSTISQIKYISAEQGEALKREATEKLPVIILRSGNKRRHVTTHICRSTRKHRHYRLRAAQENLENHPAPETALNTRGKTSKGKAEKDPTPP